MRNKFIAVMTLVSFAFFDWACTSYRTVTEPADQSALQPGTQTNVLAVLTKSGEKIEFSKQRPGLLRNGEVIGLAANSFETIALSPEEYLSIKRKAGGQVTEVRTKAGKVYALGFGSTVQSIIMDGEGRIVVTVPEAVKIPLASCELVWLRRVDAGMTFVAVLGGIALTIGAVVVFALLFKESCPFIYSYDGREYVFDAEPYGGATSRGFQRTEWCGLENLVETDGQYRFRLTNEVDETQHTDEFRLVVIDHPAGLKVAADESGALHTLATPLAPTAARDGAGRDLMLYVKDNDWMYWQSRLEEKDPERDADLRDEIVLEFPKPEGATRAKLLFNGGSTLWASQMLKRFLMLYGDGVSEYYEAVDGPGPAKAAVEAWIRREQTYRLDVLVETGRGWEARANIVGGGPFITEDRVYLLDLSGVSGPTVRLKLAPPAGFWTINHAALDYSENRPVSAIEIEPFRAVDDKGRDIRDLLARDDGRAYVAPERGESADVVFQAPPRKPGLVRTVLAKVGGFYEIHLPVPGTAEPGILGRLTSEPGFTVRYALREYKKWLAGPQPVHD